VFDKEMFGDFAKITLTRVSSYSLLLESSQVIRQKTWHESLKIVTRV